MEISSRSRSRPRLAGKLLTHCGRGKGMGSDRAAQMGHQKHSIQEARLGMILATARIRRCDGQNTVTGNLGGAARELNRCENAAGVREAIPSFSSGKDADTSVSMLLEP